ncbi:F-box domain, partial [Arabidopsis thaliana x Arabidopsis arenosa]
MDSEKEKTGEIIQGTSQFSSLIRPLIQWYLPNRGIFLTENAASLARSFFAKHTQYSSPKRLRTSLHDDQNPVTERKCSGSVPLDLLWEILSRLPAKSIVRSRSVSKLWSSVTTNPYFIFSFPARSSKPCVLLVFQKGDTLFVFSFPQHQNPIDPYSQVERYEVINPNHRHFACSDSVHGLICFETSKQLVIWNPTMRRFLTLPEPENSSLKYVRGFLGYDPVECQYKVLSFLANEGIRVLTLGAQESWRMIEASPLHLPAPTKVKATRNALTEFCTMKLLVV